MTPAGKLQAHLKRVVQQSGGHYRKARWEGRNGCPDCFVWWTWPNAAFIEIKAETDHYKDRYSKLQEREVGRMRDAGIPVFTARTIDEIDEIVKKVQKGVAT